MLITNFNFSSTVTKKILSYRHHKKLLNTLWKSKHIKAGCMMFSKTVVDVVLFMIIADNPTRY
jgi:hypothetical protein